MCSSWDLWDFGEERASRLQVVITAGSFLFGHYAVVPWVMNYSIQWLSNETAFEIQKGKTACAKTEPLSHPAHGRQTAMNWGRSHASTTPCSNCGLQGQVLQEPSQVLKSEVFTDRRRHCHFPPLSARSWLVSHCPKNLYIWWGHLLWRPCFISRM